MESLDKLVSETTIGWTNSNRSTTISMISGNIYIFSPLKIYNNPEKNDEPFVGLFIQNIKDPSGWHPTRFKILGPCGIRVLWCNRWSVNYID